MKSSGDSLGIKNVSGTTNIGVKGDNKITNKSPIIKVNKLENQSKRAYGIYSNAGNINFYDGIIQGKTRYGMSQINEVEEGYQLKEENIDEFNSIYLVEKEEVDIVENIETSKAYTSIREAIRDGNNMNEIQLRLLCDANLNESIIIEQGENVTLDLAGKNIINEHWKIGNKGIFTIKNSSTGGKIECRETSVGILNEGSLIIDKGVIISRCGEKTIDDKLIAVYNTGTVNLQGGIISNESVTSGYGISNTGLGKINVIDGEIVSKSSKQASKAIFSNSNGSNSKIEILGGKITSVGYGDSEGIYTVYEAGVNIYGGQIFTESIIGSCVGVNNGRNGIINISGGEINCQKNAGGR